MESLDFTGLSGAPGFALFTGLIRFATRDPRGTRVGARVGTLVALYRSRGVLQEHEMIFPLLQKELSIDDYVDRDEECRFSTLLADTQSVNQEEKIYHREVGAIVERALGRLDERELHIIRNRFGLLGGQEQTLEEIGKRMNLSRERVRQLEREAKDKLRVCLGPQRGNLRFSLA
jgi:RNA polymerase sigma factor (sigma-70 family)